MPLPTPREGQSKDDFLKSCMGNPTMNKEFPDEKQRYAVCNAQWSKRNGGESTKGKVLKRMTAEFVTTDKGHIKNLKAKTEGKYPIVAVVGNRFMNGDFVPADELKKVAHEWNNTYHNLNHGRNFNGNVMIQEVVGIHQNAHFDDGDNSVKMDVIEGENTLYYKAWKGFLELNEKTSKPVNVSMEIWCNESKEKLSDIKELVSEDDIKKFDLKDDSEINVLRDLTPKAVATVDIGAGGDDCSYEKRQEETNSDFTFTTDVSTSDADVENEEIIKENKEDTKRRNYLLNLLKQLKREMND